MADGRRTKYTAAPDGTSFFATCELVRSNPDDDADTTLAWRCLANTDDGLDAHWYPDLGEDAMDITIMYTADLRDGN